MQRVEEEAQELLRVLLVPLNELVEASVVLERLVDLFWEERVGVLDEPVRGD